MDSRYTDDVVGRSVEDLVRLHVAEKDGLLFRGHSNLLRVQAADFHQAVEHVVGDPLRRDEGHTNVP
eukprot:8748402-Alexandrium_andersonii.AAC.1